MAIWSVLLQKGAPGILFFGVRYNNSYVLRSIAVLSADRLV